MPRLSEFAAILAPHLRLSVNKVHSIARGRLILELLNAQPGGGRTSPSTYNPEEVARLRLILAAQSCGLSGEELVELNIALDSRPAVGFDVHPESAKSNNGAVSYPHSLRSLIRAARHGETWNIRIRFTLDAQGNRKIAPLVLWDGWNEESDRVNRTLDIKNNETPLGTLTIPATALIAPLLPHIPSED